MKLVFNPLTGNLDQVLSTAAELPIVDAGGFYTGTEVETALTEIGDGTTLDGRYLQIANDLSDLNNVATARTNLGLVAGGAGDIWVEKAGDVMIGVDSTTFFQVQQADTTVVLNVDTTNARVGIGTATPTRQFEIVSNVVKSSAGLTGQLAIRGTADETLKLNIGYDTTSDFGFIEAVDEGVVWKNLILQGSGGFVGIGTTTPDGALHVVNTDFPLAEFERTTGVTAVPVATNLLHGTTSGNMADGFGPFFVFAIEDEANVENYIGDFGAVRDGADNSGALIFRTYISGAVSEKFRIPSVGGILVTGRTDVQQAIFQANATQNQPLVQLRDSSDNVLSFFAGDGDLIVGEATQQTNAGTLQIGGFWTFKEDTAPTADAGYAKIWTEDNNELFYQSGDGATHLLHGDAFSNLWFHSASPDTVEITTAALLTLIDSFENIGEEDDLGNVVGNTTNNDLTIGANGAGKYGLTFHTSMSSETAASEMIITMGITLNTAIDVTGATNATPIVVTSVAHGLKNGDMVTIAGGTGNGAVDGDWIVTAKTDDTFTLVDLTNNNSVGDGPYDASSADVTIKYPGNLLMHREVGFGALGHGGANADTLLIAGDKIKLYVANVGATRDLLIAIVNMEISRKGD